MAGDDLHDRWDAADYLRGLVVTGNLWRLPPARIEALMLGLIETAAAREALERQGDDDEQPAVH